jgi:hypothetical protein
MRDTNLVFVLGSGRCGTKAIVKMLAGTPDLEAHHEYVRYYYQKEAVLFFDGLYSYDDMKNRLKSIYDGASYYSGSKTFLDSSHKLVWCAEVLRDTYPKAKYIHLIRDGRKVASSFYNKLNIHQDDANKQYTTWSLTDGQLPTPPPSEKYWWPVSPVLQYDRWQRICWYWMAMNEIIDEVIYQSDSESIQVRLEDLTTNKEEVRRVANFIGVEYRAGYWDALQRPDHVYVPINYKITDKQREQFNEIATPTMEKFGYDINKDEYDVKYPTM